MEVEKCELCGTVLVDIDNVKSCELCMIKYHIICRDKKIDNPDLCELCRANLLDDMFSSRNK